MVVNIQIMERGLGWILCGVLIFGLANAYVFPDGYNFDSRSGSTVSYDRIDEVKKQCASIISSAADVRANDDIEFRIRKDLEFSNGDWWQDAGECPILPYPDREEIGGGNFSLGVGNYSNFQKPNNLVSFWVTDVDRDHPNKKSIAVNGFLVMGTTVGSYAAKENYLGRPHFQMYQGEAQLSIYFQGLYTESKKNTGERVMCLLGSTTLPSRKSDSGHPWEWVKKAGSNYDQWPLLQDDQILLVLHYPTSFSLTSRVILGEMKSLNAKSNLKYFDEVHISSQFGRSVSYKFGFKKLVSKACDPYPYNDDTAITAGLDIYRGDRFCEVLDQITGYGTGVFKFVPNWRCNGTDGYCVKLGPFDTNQQVTSTNGSFDGIELFMQDVRCEQRSEKGNASSATVAAVFRVDTLVQNYYAVSMRSGLSNMTVAAEGTWKSSNGQLCMVGCLGLVDSEGTSCTSRICLYIPLSFSVKQRNIIVGSFSSMGRPNASYYPLSFGRLVHPNELWNYVRTSNPYYTYSKIERAGIVLEKNEAFTFGTVIKKSLLTYPKLEDAEAVMTSLSNLAEDLTLQTSAFPDPSASSKFKGTSIQMDILSIGPLFGRYWFVPNTSIGDAETPYHSKAEYTEKQLLLNVSAQMGLSGEAYRNFSVLFLEGLYDPHVGKMYLVGCRDVRASWNILLDSKDLEDGLDCSIEVVVSYPPTTTRWLVNPTVSISIASQRNDDDPLRFNTTKLQSRPIMYQRQREDILSRRGVEAILRILTLSFAIACITSQIFYIRNNVDSVPFMSLVMLGTQALGYSLPLITGAEALFRKKSSESYYESSYDLERNQWFHVVDYIIKLLVLVSFLLTLRLCQKVWRSRLRLLSRAPLEPHRVPSDRWVLIVTSIIHVIGYVIVLVIHAAKSETRPFQTQFVLDSVGRSRRIRQWEVELEEYIGLVQDFFLFPQVIGNFIWQTDCKPLRKLYFVGITVVRLLPHLYDYLRAPIQNPYFASEYEFVNPNMDFYSKFGDIAIPATAVLLAAVVYIQQRWSYDKLSQILTFGRCRLLPLRSRMYERLPSKSFEAELASSAKENATLDAEHDNED